MNTIDLGETFLIAMGSLIGLCIVLLSLTIVFSICFRILFGGRRKKKDKAAETAETKMIQEIHHGLSKMEDRIDSLETLLLSKEERWAEEQKLHEFEQKIHRG